jgi:hypothetical protein
MMEAKATMRPGQKGTKKLTARFGERLLFVRYRYDAKRRKRFTTVELIVDEADWTPPPTPIVRLRVGYWETNVQNDIRACGGKWDRRNKVWLLPLDQARRLRLERRILANTSS